MDPQTLARAVEILEAEPALYLAVQRLWEILRQEGLLGDTSVDQFQHDLEADGRFEFTQAPMLPGMSADESRRALQALDLFSGPSVKLASRPVTIQALLDGMAYSLRQLDNALLRAWEARPPGDLQAEQVLREAMERAATLRREIEDVITSHRPPQPKEGSPT